MPCTIICIFKMLYNFIYTDNNFIIEAFKAWNWAFSAWKEAILCLERVFL